MSQLLPIPQTIALLKRCWETAEARVCREVGTKYRESDEEAITVLLCGELRQEFDERNVHREFEYAFAADLRVHFPFRDLNWVSHGLIGRVAHHPKHVEKTTGGDFGLVIGRPQVEHRWETDVSMHSQGYLCRRKCSRKRQSWQTDEGAAYGFAFVLYMYAPGGPELAPFAWVRAGGRQLPAVEADLARLNGAHSKTINGFREIMTGSVVSSTDILEAVSQGARGTSDKQVIDTEICPVQASSVTIEITWRDGKPPEPSPQKIRHQVYVKQRA